MNLRERALREHADQAVQNQTEMRGLICEIYAPARGGCSNGGISSIYQAVTLIGIPTAIFVPVTDRPAVRLVKRAIAGKIYLHVEPVDQPSGLIGPMFGGTFIYSSDSRFPSQYPIALHDRWETQEQYDALAR